MKAPDPTFSGSFKADGGTVKFAFTSPGHFMDWCRRQSEGAEFTVTFCQKKRTRSQGQLAYYWVILGYLAEYVGCKDVEMHEIVMRRKFGTKIVVVDGVREVVRRSVSDGARMPKDEMGELIEFALELAERLDVTVPTPQQAGYISNH